MNKDRRRFRGRSIRMIAAVFLLHHRRYQTTRSTPRRRRHYHPRHHGRHQRRSLGDLGLDIRSPPQMFWILRLLCSSCSRDGRSRSREAPSFGCRSRQRSNARRNRRNPRTLRECHGWYRLCCSGDRGPCRRRHRRCRFGVPFPLNHGRTQRPSTPLKGGMRTGPLVRSLLGDPDKLIRHQLAQKRFKARLFEILLQHR